jgi:4-amino-4-deoxy-L-arabinose transferase-like glycosyltransferase
MKMTALVKKHLSGWGLGVLLVCLLFAINKIKYLGLPYFWDEAWVYAPAVFDMFENGPSLRPDSIDPLLSRGHPILFHFLAVCWMTIFGTSFSAVHSFAVFIAILLIMAVYKLGEALASRSVGFWSAALLAMQPIFIQQAGFLLPEIMLALFVTLTVLFYIKRKMWLYLAAGSAMLLTKETGILVIAAICVVELFEFLRQRDFSRDRIIEFLATGSPVILAFLYFLVQYFQFGWFVFPEHVSMFDTDPEIWAGKRDTVFKILFQEQQRHLIIGIALACGSLAWQKGPELLRGLLFICGLTFATLTGLNSWLPDWFFDFAFPVIIGISLILLGREMLKGGPKTHLFIPLVGIIVPTMLVFTASHFVIARYLLFLIPLVILTCVLIIWMSTKRSAWLFNTVVVCLGLVLYHFVNRADNKMNHVGNMHYVDQIHVLQKGIEFLETETGFSECIAGSFLIQQALMNPVQGYVSEELKPTCVKNYVAPDAEYVMLINCEVDAGLEWVKVDQNFQLVFTADQGIQTTWVYKRIGG